MLSSRLLLLRIVLLLVVLFFAGRLAYLQLWQGTDWRRVSAQNHLRWVRAPAPRGRILDRQGRPLATSIPAMTVWLVSGEVRRDQWESLLPTLVGFGLYPNAAAAATALEDCRHFTSYVPVRLLSGLSNKDPRVARIEEALPFLPGIYLKTDPVRYYPEGALAAHLIGYESEIDADGLQKRREQGYRLGDRLGKTGVESAFEDQLRGTDGGEQVEVDACGRKLSEAAKLEPRAGEEVTLTIDLDIQRAAEAAMAGHNGAVVALDPNTGDILAMVSAPSFDLNAPGGARSEFNRAVRGQYPPGSVFKIITAAAGLEDGKINPNTYFYCDGAYQGIRCWKHDGHGAQDLVNALAHSCNVYFMHTAERLGADELAKMARRFGLDQSVDIDGVLTGKAGVVPNPAWAKRVMHRAWEPGDTLQMGMGQSSLTVTPLQSAFVAAAIANGGHLVRPRLIQRIGDKTQPTQPPTPLGLKAETLRWIERGLRAVVVEGTAKQLDASLQIAGKTGTAQNPGGADHAWFVGYAPANHPTIAIAVLVEQGGHGGVVAAPIAEAIIRAAQGKR